MSLPNHIRDAIEKKIREGTATLDDYASRFNGFPGDSKISRRNSFNAWFSRVLISGILLTVPQFVRMVSDRDRLGAVFYQALLVSVRILRDSGVLEHRHLAKEIPLLLHAGLIEIDLQGNLYPGDKFPNLPSQEEMAEFFKNRK